MPEASAITFARGWLWQPWAENAPRPAHRYEEKVAAVMLSKPAAPARDPSACSGQNIHHRNHRPQALVIAVARRWRHGIVPAGACEAASGLSCVDTVAWKWPSAQRAVVIAKNHLE